MGEVTWRDVRDGRTRETKFGDWAVEEFTELRDDGVVCHPPILVAERFFQVGLVSFTDVREARSFARELLDACDHADTLGTATET